MAKIKNVSNVASTDVKVDIKDNLYPKEIPIDPIQIEPVKQNNPKVSTTAINVGSNREGHINTSIGHNQDVNGSNRTQVNYIDVNGSVPILNNEKDSLKVNFGGALGKEKSSQYDNTYGVVYAGLGYERKVNEHFKITAGAQALKGLNVSENQVNQRATAYGGVQYNPNDDLSLKASVSINNDQSKLGRGTTYTVRGGADYNIDKNQSVGLNIFGNSGNAKEKASVGGSVNYRYNFGGKKNPENNGEVINLSKFNANPPAPVNEKEEFKNIPLIEKKEDSLKISLGNNQIFKFDSATISKDGKKQLDELVNVLDSTKLLKSGKSILEEMASNGNKINIAGFTDAKGSDKYNEKLSERRAKNVEKYLISKGIDEKRLESFGFGETRAQYSNADIKQMEKDGLSRSQIIERTSSDRKTVISIPGAFEIDSKYDKLISDNIKKTNDSKDITNVNVLNKNAKEIEQGINQVKQEVEKGVNKGIEIFKGIKEEVIETKIVKGIGITNENNQMKP